MGSLENGSLRRKAYEEGLLHRAQKGDGDHGESSTSDTCWSQREVTELALGEMRWLPSAAFNLNKEKGDGS